MTQTNDFKLITKTVILGLIVSAIGIWAPVALLIFLPGIAGILAWMAFMALFVTFMSGKWGWKTTQSSRARLFRSDTTSTMTMREIAIGLILAALFVVFGQSAAMVTFRLTPYPYEAFTANTNYEALSPTMVWVMIILSALGAAVYEEIGFRGYMQVPLEGRYGLLKTNILVSVVFMLLHLNQLWAPPLLPWLFVLSFMFGVIAYVTRSLWYAILAHFILDIFNFGYWWSDFFGVYDHELIFQGGVDQHFVFWSVILVLSTILFIYVSRIGLAMRKSVDLESQSTALQS